MVNFDLSLFGLFFFRFWPVQMRQQKCLTKSVQVVIWITLWLLQTLMLCAFGNDSELKMAVLIYDILLNTVQEIILFIHEDSLLSNIKKDIDVISLLSSQSCII